MEVTKILNFDLRLWECSKMMFWQIIGGRIKNRKQQWHLHEFTTRVAGTSSYKSGCLQNAQVSTTKSSKLSIKKLIELT